MNTIFRSKAFNIWLTELKDNRGKARIVARIRSAELGNFGDCVPVGQNISEMRIHFGPGYRVYFTRIESTTYALLCGGIKRTQKRDIVQAQTMAEIARED